MASHSSLPIDIEIDEVAEIKAAAEAFRNSRTSVEEKTDTPDGFGQTISKLLKVLSESEVEDLNAMSETDLRSRIVTVQRQRSDNAIAREIDVDLKKAREEVKELAAPYAETEKHLAAITSYAVLRLAQLGK